MPCNDTVDVAGLYVSQELLKTWAPLAASGGDVVIRVDLGLRPSERSTSFTALLNLTLNTKRLPRAIETDPRVDGGRLGNPTKLSHTS